MARGTWSQELLDEIRSRTDIVAVVSKYVGLRASGRNLVGLCPFHEEKSPSFTVNPEKGIFYCFGCHAGGDVFAFIMKIEGVSFPEAVGSLAKELGLEPDEGDPSGASGLKERAFRALALAQSFYSRMLWEEAIGEKCRRYLAQRSIEKDVAVKFGLGFAPPGWRTLWDELRRQGVTAESAVAAGLIAQSRRAAARSSPSRGYYDVFRDRLLFPIHGESGRIVGFGGRLLGDDPGEGPKYLNSPESAVFSKGRCLYGIPNAREGMRRSGCAILVEGYLDVMMCHQHGYDNVVAPLGTALTKEQARLILRYAPKAIIAYDADSAGQAATVRGLEVMEKAGCAVRVAMLPAGLDPDETIRSEGAGRFAEAIANAVPLMDYRLMQIAKKYDLGVGQEKIRAASEMAALVAKSESALEREHYASRIASMLGFSETAVAEEIRERTKGRALDKLGAKGHNIPGKKKMANAGRLSARETPGRVKAEKQLLAMALMHFCCLRALQAEMRERDFASPVHRRIYRALVEGNGPDELFSVGRLLDALRDDAEAMNAVAELLSEPAVQELPREEAEDDPAAERAMGAFGDLLAGLRRFIKDEELVGLSLEIRRHEGEGRVPPPELIEQYARLLVEQKGSRPELEGDARRA